MPATLTITSGRHSLQTVTHGVKPSTRPCPLSKKTAWTASRRNGTGGRHVWLRFQSQTRPSPATTATGHASPASALSATCVPAGDVDDPILNLRSRSHAMNIVLAYLMLFAALTNSVCLYNASFFAIDFCKCFLFSCFVFVY